MVVPETGIKGSFTFLEPFNVDEYQNKILEVISVRRLNEMYANGDDPYNNIYVKNGLSQDDYIDDLQNDRPVAVLSAPGGVYYNIPCSKIESIPTSTGVPYIRRVIAISLGSLPYDYSLETIKEDIEDIIREKLYLKSEAKILDASAPYYKSYEDHEMFERWMDTNPTLRGTKSFKVLYQEATEKLDKLTKDYEDLTSFMLANFENNVRDVNRPNENDLLQYTKRLTIELVSRTLVTRPVIYGLKFYEYDKFNELPKVVYGNSYNKVDEKTYRAMIGNTPMSLELKTGITSVNIPNMFSDTTTLSFDPTEAVMLEITLDKAMNIRDYELVAYLNQNYFCNVVRVKQYNSNNTLICNRVYNYHPTTGDFTQSEPTIKAGKLTFGLYEDVTEPLTPPVQ